VSRLRDTVSDLVLGPSRNRPAPFGLLLILALILALALLFIPEYSALWQALVVFLVLDLLFVVVRIAIAMSSLGGPAVRLIRDVRDLRGDSFVFMSLLSSSLVGALAQLGIPASLRQVWMTVAVSPHGIELWTQSGPGPAYTIEWTAISSFQDGVELLGARFANDADQTVELEITANTVVGPLDFQFGVFDDRRNPARRELLQQLREAVRRYRPAAKP